MTGRAPNQVRTSDVPPHLVRGILLLHDALGCNTLPMFAWRLRRCMAATLNPRTPLVPFMPPPMKGGMLSLARAVLRKHHREPSFTKTGRFVVPRLVPPRQDSREREALDIMVKWERVWSEGGEAIGWLGGFDLMREAREADWREHNERLNRDIQRVRDAQLTRETTRMMAQALENYWNLTSDAGAAADAERRAAAPFEPIPVGERTAAVREQQRAAVPDDAPVVVAWCHDGRRHHRVISVDPERPKDRTVGGEVTDPGTAEDWDALADKVTRGAMTINQARAAMGLGPYRAGDLITMDGQPVGYHEVLEGEIIEGAPLALPAGEEQL